MATDVFVEIAVSGADEGSGVYVVSSAVFDDLMRFEAVENTYSTRVRVEFAVEDDLDTGEDGKDSEDAACVIDVEASNELTCSVDIGDERDVSPTCADLVEEKDMGAADGVGYMDCDWGRVV